MRYLLTNSNQEMLAHLKSVIHKHATTLSHPPFCLDSVTYFIFPSFQSHVYQIYFTRNVHYRQRGFWDAHHISFHQFPNQSLESLLAKNKLDLHCNGLKRMVDAGNPQMLITRDSFCTLNRKIVFYVLYSHYLHEMIIIDAFTC